MAITGIKIDHIPAGATTQIVRTYEGLPSGITLVKAYLTIEKELGDDPGAIQIEITQTLTSAGQITDPISSDGAISFYFNLTSAQTLLLKPHKTYVYDIQGIGSDGAVHPFEVECEITPLWRSTEAVT